MKTIAEAEILFSKLRFKLWQFAVTVSLQLHLEELHVRRWHTLSVSALLSANIYVDPHTYMHACTHMYIHVHTNILAVREFLSHTSAFPAYNYVCMCAVCTVCTVFACMRTPQIANK